MSSLEPEKYACYNETFLYQGYKNNTIQRKFEMKDRQKLPCYNESLLFISARFNKSPLYLFMTKINLSC